MRPLLESRRLGGGSGLWPCRPGARGSAPRRRGGAGRGERVCTGRGGPPGARCGAARAGRGSALTPGLGVPALPQVEVIKKAYMQGEVEVEDSESDEEDGGNGEDGAASPRNVGHNIYILAHQVPARRARPTHTPALRLHPGLASVPDGVPGAILKTLPFPARSVGVTSPETPRPREHPPGQQCTGLGCVWSPRGEPRVRRGCRPVRLSPGRGRPRCPASRAASVGTGLSLRLPSGGGGGADL